jgi:hypothetical protein
MSDFREFRGGFIITPTHGFENRIRLFYTFGA